jgi:hypothetical protein
MRETYRADTRAKDWQQSDGFFHSDKVVRIHNFYARNPKTRAKELRLSNGSVGVLCKNKQEWRSFLPESQYPLDWDRMDPDDFELAYGLTVQQGAGQRV